MFKSLTSLFIFFLLLFTGCKTVESILNTSTPRERLIRSYESLELDNKPLIKKWEKRWDEAKLEPLSVQIPYQEKGILFEANPSAVALRIEAEKGEVITIRVQSSFEPLVEVFKVTDLSTPIAHFDLDADSLNIEVKYTEDLLVVFQSTLLDGGVYTLSISSKGSLPFPVSGKNSKAIQSFWGANRDGGQRKHEGVDIFAEKGTPVLAVTNGFARASQSTRGGKVVWLYQPSKGRNYYYAHLDSQLVNNKSVKIADTLGFVGNTGNAKYTPPHLHFGIYESGRGATDPFPFIDDSPNFFKEISADTSLLGTIVNTTQPISNLRLSPLVKENSLDSSLFKNSLSQVVAATENWFRILLENGTQRYIYKSLIRKTTPQAVAFKGDYSFKKFNVNKKEALKVTLNDTLEVFGEADGYKMVFLEENLIWVKPL